jgi:DNA-binding transcriptional regulator YdaS (Cro superfamily)
MFFLLRMTFWLGLVLVLLPIGASQRSQSSNEVSATEAISAASATVGDLRGFCDRQPDACTVGSQVATAIGYRAQAGAKMLYEALTDAMAPHDTGAIAGGTAAKRGSITRAAMDKPVIERASQNTLTPSDLAPAWRGPQLPRKDAKHAA